MIIEFDRCCFSCLVLIKSHAHKRFKKHGSLYFEFIYVELCVGNKKVFNNIEVA